MKILLLNAFLLAGAGSASYGLWWYSKPLALVLVGIAVMAVAFIVGVSLGDKHPPRDL